MTFTKNLEMQKLLEVSNHQVQMSNIMHKRACQSFSNISFDLKTTPYKKLTSAHNSAAGIPLIPSKQRITAPQRPNQGYMNVFQESEQLKEKREQLREQRKKIMELN